MININKNLIMKITKGTEVLSSGGGGYPYNMGLMALQLLKENRKSHLIEADKVPNNALVFCVASIGSPLVLKEKISNGMEAMNALRMLETYFGEKTYAIVPMGQGTNALIPIVAGLNGGVPIVDGDGMGRAFPELQMTTFHLYGVSVCPMAISDEKGNTIFVDSINNYHGEWFARGITVLMGGNSWLSFYAMTGKELKRSVIKGTLTKSSKIGEILISDISRKHKIDKICEYTGGSLLGEGRISGIERRKYGKYYGGRMEISGSKKIKITFQNEYLIAETPEETVSVPDIITLLSRETLKPISTEDIEYGKSVYVLTIPADEKWKTKKGLKIVGPEAFGLENVL